MGSRQPGRSPPTRVGAAMPEPASLSTMEAEQVDALSTRGGWQFEPKWDGFRCLAFKSGDSVDLRAKSGKPLGRYFPDVVEGMARLPIGDVVLDGELLIPLGTQSSFEALQQRLHTAASRVAKLAREAPAVLVVFDLLFTKAAPDLAEAPLRTRRRALESFFASMGKSAGEILKLSPASTRRADAERWLGHLGRSLDGIIAKRLDDAYRPGERAMLKIKRMRTADCVIGGFRYGQGEKIVGSLLLGLYDREGLLDHVGYTSSIPAAQRLRVTKRLESLIAPPGFTGKAPGAPSRWSTERTGAWQPLKPELVVEVMFDHMTGDRFRHGARLLRWRPDKAPQQCTFEQIELEAAPPEVVADMLRH